jgi:uncharacterized membrane protein
MTDTGPEGLRLALADLDELRLELAEVTRDWRLSVVVRTYDPNENGQEDYDDEAMLFEEHGYAHSSTREWAGNPPEWLLTATYTKDIIEGEGGPAIIVRTYQGKQQADAVVLFEADAVNLAVDGYSPTTQSWAQGQWGCGAFLVALLLCIVLVGFLVFIYMLLVKPVGTLTVTYERTAPTVASRDAPRPVVKRAPKREAETPVSDPEARLAKLERLRATGAITDDEFAARRNKILDEI